ncbi:LADA_0C01552g1_1 [Lachancea dasiensis]|uniref:LADA_0C01552g1_1 n=1 Tax=Lachancea dasiensis TaxID=1072105 RepID=A0A1G4IXK6_9SACH|nr:LADA_0C01552g1_1 [Lachancea dasiensis]
MSFHQPSLSLYDVLDALSRQAAFRQERSESRRPQARGHYGRFNNRPTVVNSGFQSPYYPAERPRSSYYRPRYYQEYDEFESPHLWSEYERPRAAPVETREQEVPDFLPRLLRAVAEEGAMQRQYQEPEESEDYDGASNHIEHGQPSGIPLLDALLGNTFRGSEVGDTEEPKEPKEPKEPIEAAPMDAEVESQINPTPAALDTQSSPTTKENVQAAVEERSDVPSPIPDPLQVSKPQKRRGMPFSPAVNVYDTDEAYVVVMALPGATSKSFKIDYHPSSHELFIKGSLDNRSGLDEKTLRVSELRLGKFSRSFKLPVLPRIQDEAIKATYNNGLLQVKIPKILNESHQHPPKRHIVIEDVPDEELEFEKNPNPPTSL